VSFLVIFTRCPFRSKFSALRGEGSVSVRTDEAMLDMISFFGDENSLFLIPFTIPGTLSLSTESGLG
jgi:hypothetical protein